MSGDSRSKTLAVGNSSGHIFILSCDTQGEWKASHSIAPAIEIPVTALCTLHRGDNLYIAGFANGQVKIITPGG